MLPTPGTATEFCVQCKEPRFIGTRCFRCYVRRLARDHDLLKYAWMSRCFEKFVAVMRGRYNVIRAGGDPPPLDASLRSIWTNGARPYWISHPSARRVHKPKVNSEARLRTLIRVIEERAVEDREHETDTGSEAGR